MKNTISIEVGFATKDDIVVKITEGLAAPRKWYLDLRRNRPGQIQEDNCYEEITLDEFLAEEEKPYVNNENPLDKKTRTFLQAIPDAVSSEDKKEALAEVTRLIREKISERVLLTKKHEEHQEKKERAISVIGYSLVILFIGILFAAVIFTAGRSLIDSSLNDEVEEHKLIITKIDKMLSIVEAKKNALSLGELPHDIILSKTITHETGKELSAKIKDYNSLKLEEARAGLESIEETCLRVKSEITKTPEYEEYLKKADWWNSHLWKPIFTILLYIGNGILAIGAVFFLIAFYQKTMEKYYKKKAYKRVKLTYKLQ